MTAILRILNVTVEDSTDIQATFTESLTPNLVAGNVSIISQTDNIPDAQCLKVSVSGNALFITCQPLTPYATYLLQFQSTDNSPFISTNGDAKISQDGVSNTIMITGPLSSDNPVMDFLQSYYRGNIYNTTDTTTVISQFLQSIAVNFSRALYDIRQLKNENYLSFTIVDELHTRGPGPFDRLFEEGVYEVFRVGYGPTNDPVPTTFVFTDFPDYPVTLQRQLVTEIILPSSNNTDGTFNINTLTFNLSNNPVTRVDSITFTLLTSDPEYVYDLSRLGYQLLNSEYDQDFASSYLLLADNQVKLNESILQDPKFSLDQIFNINVQYEYKGLGIQVDPASVDVFTTLQSVREVLPPITNIFNLQHAPITDQSNNVPLINGVIFTDPNSNTGAPHPAFIAEIPFSLSSLPFSSGVYAIDYPTGTVYVYGSDTTNDGTGPSPPLATYYYQFTYTSETDYVYDADALNLVALPLGNLLNSAGTVGFNYEQVLIPGVDYNAEVHIEAINERIGNNLTALNSLTTQNTPITNVFQIYNETSGEIYTLDRWYNNIVYFRYHVPPRIAQELGENATFLTVPNELLAINTTSVNSNSLRIFTVFLANNTIINSTQDGIGASFNSSVSFTNGNVFQVELWYNQEFGADFNVNQITTIGQYTVDYNNGIVYVAVSANQLNDIGTVSYKMNSIVPEFPHVISVDDIYYRISILNPKNKQFVYTSFGDGFIVPTGLDVSDEAFLNDVLGSPFQILQGQIGAFIGSTFVAGVSNAVKFVRSVFEYNDLSHNTHPINFAAASTSSNFNITVGSLNRQSFESVQFDGTHYFITLNENIPYLSPDIIFAFSVIRTSDQAQLWNGSGVIVAGNPLKLILPGINSPQIGDLTNVQYSFTIAPVSRVVVDYNKGDFFIDYTYLADEILVSYEYGDNVLDFRQNTTVPTNFNYYVSYRAGALRTALLANFGTLVNVPDLATFDLSLDRERYREALQAALSSFIQGPTIAAIKNIGQIITHVEPQVIESAFQVWSLGSNLLNPVGIETTGAFQLLPAHFGNGILVDQPNQTITMPASSNLRLEEGSFESWIFPQWNGLDNDAALTFSILRDGYVIDPYRVFVGGSEYHPTIANGAFNLSKADNVSGQPNTNKDGVFIYYANDPSNNFQRWYIEVIDGYVAKPNNHTYQFQIASSGKFYDARSLTIPAPVNMTTFSGTNKINLTISPLMDGYGIDQGITFVSDLEHYFLDFGKTNHSNRLSIFKDVSGYLNFRVFDRNNKQYSVSADVSSWQVNQAHFIAASWKLNTRNQQDEMHLFIDGLEVPNIIKYGQKLLPYPGENFRTVDPETIVGLATRDIVGSIDLTTTLNTPIVSSSINFSEFQIFIGDTIVIDELGFSSSGYVIESIDGQTLTLNANMPATLNANGRYSVNQTSFDVSSEIEVYPNIAISTIHVLTASNDLSTFNGSPIVSSAGTNFTTANVLPGYLLRIDNGNFDLTYPIIAVSNNSLTLNTNMPITLNSLTFQVYPINENEIPGVRALNPSYEISQDANFNNVLTLSNDVLANDLILIRTLGLNFQDVDKQYYVWSDGYENILMTQLPAPLALDQVNITKTILPIVAIGPSNSTLTAGVFISNNLLTSQPTNIIVGRTLEITISGTNVDFTTPVQVAINGNTNETLTFNNYGAKNSIHRYSHINFVQVNAKPLNPAKNALAIVITEAFQITTSELGGTVPVIRYSYVIGAGNSLSSSGINTVSDPNFLFSGDDIGNTLFIQNTTAAGYYTIDNVSLDRHSLILASSTTTFSNAKYQVLNTTQYRSGLQNGFFTLEIANQPGQPFLLNSGLYDISYATYLSIRFAPINTSLFIGSDLNGHSQANSIIDHLSLSSIMLTDTRIGEVVSANTQSITKDYNSFKATKPNSNTLALIDFDAFPLTNDAGFYAATNTDRQHFWSDFAPNDNFQQSIVILDQPILVPNTGILNTQKQGTIEFWMSPIFDTANDPNTRYYFDAYGAVVETATSVSNVAVKISTPASQILSVVLASGDTKIDYFAGGSLEIDTQEAIQETAQSIGTGSVIVSQPILQVITVKIVGDFTGKDYFGSGSIGSDGFTIFLGTPLPVSNVELVITYQSTNNDDTHLNGQVIRLNRILPAQNSQVVVKYLPAGLQGDRLSLFKDQYGYFNFAIAASGMDFVIRTQLVWAKNTWHRVKASYKVNGGIGNDEMRLWLDGYSYESVFVGDTLVPGIFPSVMGGDGYVGSDGYKIISGITFKDPINDLFIGSAYDLTRPAFTLLDNLRISDISRPIVQYFNEPIDVNWASNIAIVQPVTIDLFTTYLLDFNRMNKLITNFATLVDIDDNDFTVNIFDSFGIVASSIQVKNILESLLHILSPAQSRLFIRYIPQ